MTRLLCFGDSITLGTADPQGGWPQRLQNKLGHIFVEKDGTPKHSAYNLGISAETSEGLRARIESEITARLGWGEPITLIAIGTNDAALKNGEPWVSGEDFVENMREIITVAKKHSKAVLVVGLLPCQDEKLNPVPWAKDDEYVYSMKAQNAYNAAAKKVADELEVDFQDLMDVFGEIDLDTFMVDGLHPNGVGYQFVADQLYKWVAEKANGFAEVE